MPEPVDNDLLGRIDTALAAFLDDRAAALAEVGPELAPVAEQARRFVLDGGKRLRPTFAYWGWRTVRAASADDTTLVASAAALELLHACALVHDDLMDASATRRGRPATHTWFAALHREQAWTGDPAAFGAAAAILTGDLLLTWADAMFVGAGLPSAVQPASRRVYDDMRQVVMAGQYLDVLVQAQGRFSADDALRVARFKTSRYTIEGPLHLGAAAAGAPAETFAALTAYGLPLGEAFQLRDDVLGVFGNPEETGKPAGDDLREGKRTLLVALAMERATPAQSSRLRRDLGDRSIDAAEVAALREIILTTGALDLVEERIVRGAAQARAALDSAAISPEARAALDALASAATDRRT